MQFSNAAGNLKTKKKARSTNQTQKHRYKGYKRIDKFNSNKAEPQQQRGIAAREAALEHRGIKQQFCYAGHATIYNFA